MSLNCFIFQTNISEQLLGIITFLSQCALCQRIRVQRCNDVIFHHKRIYCYVQNKNNKKKTKSVQNVQKYIKKGAQQQ